MRHPGVVRETNRHESCRGRRYRRPANPLPLGQCQHPLERCRAEDGGQVGGPEADDEIATPSNQGATPALPTPAQADSMVKHLTLEELESGLPEILESPKDRGILRDIVILPSSEERLSLEECEISPELGVHGDNWARGCWLSLPDGRPHPDVQVAIMNARTIALIARLQERRQLAGDNLYVDLDLSDENLTAGQRLAVGSAILEITETAHHGCSKFSQRYGPEALKFVNSATGKRLRLRGIYARIVQAGVIRVEEEIRKV